MESSRKHQLESLEEITDIRPSRSVPGWIKEMGYEGTYTAAQLPMSTISVPIHNLTFGSDALAQMLNAGSYKHGILLCRLNRNGISYLPGYDIRKDKEQKENHRGRKAHKNIKPKRQFGPEPSFGTSTMLYIQIRYRPNVDVPSIAGKTVLELFDKDNDTSGEDFITQNYKIKIFATSFQVSGAKMEAFEDVYRISLLVANLLVYAYNNIPDVPDGFDILQAEHIKYGEPPFACPPPNDIKKITFGPPKILLQNYIFHPLRLNQPNGKDYSVNLAQLYTFLTTEKEEINTIIENCGLIQIQVSYYQPSDNTKHRLQILFITPKIDSSLYSTTTVIYISGKIGISLANEYFWKDILWRIFGFISQVIKPEFIRPKVHLSRNKQNISQPINDINTLMDEFWSDSDQDDT